MRVTCRTQSVWNKSRPNWWRPDADTMSIVFSRTVVHITHCLIWLLFRFARCFPLSTFQQQQTINQDTIMFSVGLKSLLFWVTEPFAGPYFQAVYIFLFIIFCSFPSLHFLIFPFQYLLQMTILDWPRVARVLDWPPLLYIFLLIIASQLVLIFRYPEL